MKKSVSSIFGVVGLSLALTGCGGPSEDSASSVNVSGSTSVTELMEVLGETWEKGSGVVVEVQGTGSSAGIRAANDGTSQIGMSSRGVSAEELDGDIEKFTLAHDGIAVVVNNENAISDLSIEDISAIYRGDINNWQDVGGADQPIVVVTRDPASGTRGAFEDIMSLKEKDANGNTISTIINTAQVAPGNGAVKTTVAQNDLAIGYISLGSVDESLKPLMVGGIEASDENISNGSYGIARPFVLLFSPENQSESSTAYLEWLSSPDAQSVVAEMGYIPVI